MISEYTPSGDQPTAIADLTRRVKAGEPDIVLLGATGTGKSATTAWLIEQVQRPTLVLAHNKTLAAQLANEFRELMPNNAVEYFVSYYDYYQPEAYVPQTDTFIEKDSSVNAEVERLRHSTTNSLLSRRDVIVVSTVSCIYGLGAAEEYLGAMVALQVGQRITPRRARSAASSRCSTSATTSTSRAGASACAATRSRSSRSTRSTRSASRCSATRSRRCTRCTRSPATSSGRLDAVSIFPATHYAASPATMQRAMGTIRTELDDRLGVLKRESKLLEEQRLRMRTSFDLEMMEQIGFCNGIENYSRHIDGRAPGEAPNCLLDYFPDDFLTVIDESHVTVPQIGAMYEGDASRKRVLVEHGFRLPSALDNRPLTWEEFSDRVGPDRLPLRDARSVRARHGRRRRRADHPAHRAHRPADRRSSPPRAGSTTCSRRSTSARRRTSACSSRR